MLQLRPRVLALAVVAVVLGTCVPSAAATTLVVNEKANHKTVTIKRGSALLLSLNSTYWDITPLPSSSPVVQIGTVAANPIFPGPNAPTGCQVPGSGCGTLTWRFKAIKVGRTSIIATRNSCGEAMQCAPDRKMFSIKVIVTK